MKRLFFSFAISAVGLYVALHLALGSSPVQRRVLDALRKELAEIGIELNIESIEFSALSPRIYLNRVTLSTRPEAPFQIAEPLSIDKVKLQFRPLSLIYRQIFIDELVLFHPRILLPNVDEIYQKISTVLKTKKKQTGRTSSDFSLELKKVGFVDGLFQLSAKTPKMALRSRSLTVFLVNDVREQRNVTVESPNVELDYDDVRAMITRIDCDVDTTPNSVRVNRGIIESNILSVQVKGVSSIPQKGNKAPDLINVTYDLKTELDFLNKISGLSLPKFTGRFESNGQIKTQKNDFQGTGAINYSGIAVDGYSVGDGTSSFKLNEKTASLTDAKFRWSGGELTSDKISVELNGQFPIAGDIHVKGVRLEKILDGVKATDVPVRLETDGLVHVSGSLYKPFELNLDLENSVKAVSILNDDKKPVGAENNIIAIKEGTIVGRLQLLPGQMNFNTKLDLLGGKSHVEGYLEFGEHAWLKIQGEKLSLTELGTIAGIPFAGETNLDVELDVNDTDASIAGTFNVSNAEIAKLVLGDVRGQIYFNENLLGFENLEMKGLEPIRGKGFVDFAPVHTHYRFEVDGRRVSVDSAFSIFQKTKAGFQIPEGGEASAKVLIEGGHDNKGIQVVATGQARALRWYNEDWQSATYQLNYRPDSFDVERLMLMKRSGGVQVKALILPEASRLTFTSFGLRIDELSVTGRSPIGGELVGEVQFRGDEQSVFRHAEGDIKLVKATFRGEPVADSELKLRPLGAGYEVNAAFFQGKGRARFVRGAPNEAKDELNLYFADFDFVPVVSAAMRKDIATIADVRASGDVTLNGDILGWSKVNGSGSLNTLDLGFRGTPLRNRSPIQFKVTDGTIQLERFQLIGADGQLTGELLLRPGKEIIGSLDGRIDLQYLQPFIPNLDFGVGKISVGLRISGDPNKFAMFGNISLEDGTLRISGISDEVKNVQARISASQDKLNVDRFEGTLGGGQVKVAGDVRIQRFTQLAPNLVISTNRIGFRTDNHLITKVTGDFTLKGTDYPYKLAGQCRVVEAELTSFDTKPVIARAAKGGKATFEYDLKCEAKEKILVTTDVMNAEFKGTFHLVGTSDEMGLLGSAEAISGTLLFRETRFTLSNGNVKFESNREIAPRFSVSGEALVKELKTQSNQVPQEYAVNLTVFGTPSDFKIRLTSSPSLAEADIISLLLLGVTSKKQEGNYVDLGTTIAGQIPIQSKLKSELGVDIKIRAQGQNNTEEGTTNPTPSTGASSDITVPSVQIRKEITKKTRVSYSNTLETTPVREFKIEQILDDNFSFNATAVERSKGSTATTPTQSYGLDFRYRFQFE